MQRWREQEPGQAPLPARLPLQRDDGGAVEPAARGQDELGRTRPQLRPRLGGAASEEELWILSGENRMVDVNSGFITLASSLPGPESLCVPHGRGYRGEQRAAGGPHPAPPRLQPALQRQAAPGRGGGGAV